NCARYCTPAMPLPAVPPFTAAPNHTVVPGAPYASCLPPNFVWVDSTTPAVQAALPGATASARRMRAPVPPTAFDPSKKSAPPVPPAPLASAAAGTTTTFGCPVPQPPVQPLPPDCPLRPPGA